MGTQQPVQTPAFWIHQGWCLAKNKGIRIDHHLLSSLRDKLVNVHEQHTRDWEKPSDRRACLIRLWHRADHIIRFYLIAPFIQLRLVPQ